MIAIGIDVGGSKIAAGVVDLESGDVLRSSRVDTPVADGGAAILEQCVRLATELMGGESATVGIGLCELVDHTGRVTSAVTVDWRHLNIAEAFAGFASVAVESDVRAAGLAEARYGAGVGLETFIYIVVGTGVSYCLVLDGEPYTGARGNAILVGAPPVEERASGLALARRGGVKQAEQVLADPRNAGIVASAAASLGEAIAWLVNALDPAIVVIGGGLGLDEAYRGLVTSSARSAITADETKILPIVPSSLGNATGVIGAALVGARGIGSEPTLEGALE